MRARRTAAATAVAVTAAAVWTAAPAAAATASELTAAVLSPAAQGLVASSSLSSPSTTATAVRTDSLAGFPSRAGGSYAVLANGMASHLGNPQSDSFSGQFDSSAAAVRGNGVFDVTTLEVKLDVPATANCLLGVTFRFVTDEYPGAAFSDGFIAEVGQSTWQVQGYTINAPGNFAFDSAGQAISVNSGLFADLGAASAEAAGTGYQLASPRLTAQVPLTPGTQQSLFFSVFDHGDDSIDSAVMIDNLRIGTVADPATECVRGATLRGPEDLVSAVAPTTVDLSGTADDTYTIPATDGVVYSVGGVVKPAGTYPGTGTVVVTATAAPGFALSGPTQFTLQFSSATHVTATEPTWDDTWGTADDTYTIPSVTGVQYSVDGSPVPAGTHPATGTVTVTASATSSAYVLNGATEFTHTFTDIRQVTATEPTWDDTWGTADDTYTIPPVTGVQYSVGGTPVAAGTYAATGTVTVDATATSGYELTGPTQFTHTFTDIRRVTAVEPTWIDPLGTADDRVVIPSVTGVQYYWNGNPVSAYTYMIDPYLPEVTLTVQATAGYVLTGPTSFTYTYTNGQEVSATEPSVHDTWGTEDDTYTIPSTPRVEYLIDDEVVPAGTYDVPTPTTVTVTARATVRGDELTGPSSWTLTTTDIRLATAQEPTWNDEYGTDDDTFVIPDVTGVQYSVGGGPVAAGPHPAAAGEVTVTASATPGYVLSGPTEFTYTFTDIRLVTATAPVGHDAYGTDDDTLTIPSVQGVQYLVGGTVLEAGEHHMTGEVVVTAVATAGYELTGASQFTFTFTDIRPATAVEPTWHDEYGTDDDTFVIPTVTGLEYQVDGVTVAPGSHPAEVGRLVVTVVATSGYVLHGPSSFEFTFTDIRLVVPAAPTKHDPYGTQHDTYTIPSVTGLEYSVGGRVLAPGTYPGSGTVVVDVTATDGYVLSGVSQFTLVFTDITRVTAVAPTVLDRPGTAQDAVQIPEVTGVAYLLDGAPVAAGTHPATGDVLVTARAADARYVLVGKTTFALHLSDAEALTVPGAPTIAALVEGSRRLDVTVTAPTSDGGSPVLRYERTLDEGATWTAVDGTSFAVTGLVNGTTYRLQVRAVTAVGAGPASEAAVGTPAAAPVTVPGDDGEPAQPRVSPGDVSVWVGGAPAPVTTVVEGGRTVISGPGFNLTIGVLGADRTPRDVNADGRILVERGGLLEVSGGGFRPNEVLDLWLYSTPVLLGSVTADANGTFFGRVLMPTDVPTGEHTLQINGTRADGELVSVAAGLVLQASAEAGRPSDEPLATTGAQTGSVALLALWLLVAGGVAMVVARRRARV